MVAYIDPGAGSFVLQAIVASVAGVAVAVRMHWKKLKRFFGAPAEGASEDETTRAADE